VPDLFPQPVSGRPGPRSQEGKLVAEERGIRIQELPPQPTSRRSHPRLTTYQPQLTTCRHDDRSCRRHAHADSQRAAD
jgi:hypothetical protein